MLNNYDLYYGDLYDEGVEPDEEDVENFFYAEFPRASKKEFIKFRKGYEEFYKENAGSDEEINKFAKALAEETWKKFKQKAKELDVDVYDIDEAFTDYLNNYVY